MLTTSLAETALVEKRVFRSDIAGLRGIAICLVVFAHYGFGGFNNGFIGVDLFFVISGFLITSTIFSKIVDTSEPPSALGGFRFVDFYLRRARRIMPAAFFVVACVLLFSWMNFGQLRFAQILNDGDMSLLFVANFNFLAQSLDYFAAASLASPFMHFWSLSIEEQFYFVWPLFITVIFLVSKKLVRSKIFWYLLSIPLLFSLAWGIWSFSIDRNLTYFSPISRIWELGMGGVFAIMKLTRRHNDAQMSTALFRLLAGGFLISSIYFVSPENYPYTLIVPVLSIAYLLYSGGAAGSDGIGMLLSSPPLVFIGNLSYSLYLWHWPILVIGREMGLIESSVAQLVALLFSLTLSFVTYKFIELPFLRIHVRGDSRA